MNCNSINDFLASKKGVHKMTVELKIGSIEHFFESAKQTAQEIDEGKKITRKHTIWIEPSNLNELLEPTELIAG
jgi:hypothetical protein